MQKSDFSSLDGAKRRILDKVPIDSLIGETVSLTRRGSRLSGLCPFHAEKSPSFYVFPDNHYYCFGCHASGDAISFVRQTKEMSFMDSMRYLAAKYGIDAPELEESARYQQRRGEHTAMSQIMVAAQEFFVNELHSPRGEGAREYLLGRGFSEANIRAFGFGLTPEHGYGLVRHLRSLRFRDEDVMRVALGVVSTKTGKLYDFFRDRIMIPIRDSAGRVIAFGGRTTVDDPAKYKNSAATPLFDKSGVLFGLDHAKDVIKERRRAIVVEGYMDALCLWQEGITEAVACMGTAFTVRQMKQLVNHARCPEVVLLFDGDRAGANATLETIEVALEVPDIRVRAALLEGGEDPDTFVRKHGAEVLRQLIDRASDLIDVVIASRLNGIAPTAVPSMVSSEFLPWLLRIVDQVKRGYLVTKIASLTGVSSDVIQAQLRSMRMGPMNESRREFKAPVEEVPTAMPTRKLTPVEVGFLGHMFNARPGEIDVALATNFAQKELTLEPLWDSFARAVLAVMAEGEGSPRDHCQSILADFTVDEAKILETITAAPESQFTSANRADSLERLMLDQKLQSVLRSIASMKQQVQLAAARAPETVSEILQQIVVLSGTLTSLERQIKG